MADAKPPRQIYKAAELAWRRRWLPVTFVVAAAIVFGITTASPRPNELYKFVVVLMDIVALAAGFSGWHAHYMYTEEEYVRELVDAKLAVELAAANKVAFNARIEAAVAAELAAKRSKLGLPAPALAPVEDAIE